MTDDVQRKLVAILSADAANYSGLMAADDVTTVRTLLALRSEITACVHQHRGRVVDTPGDNLLAEFPNVGNCVACALDAQQKLEQWNAGLPQQRRMHFRMGVHAGEVIVEGGGLYGDVINIAARLEQLAQPGGITVSGAVADQLSAGSAFRLEYIATQLLKNIPEPVRTFRVSDSTQPGAASAGDPASLPYRRQLSVPGFSGQPAIAVLPFQPLDGSLHDFFAQGITEDLITRLSRLRTYPLLSRGSTAGYEAGADVSRVRDELRVGYVVKGSVRRSATRVRITAQLIDAAHAQVIWAQQYDEALGDLFELQDRITVAIAAALEPELRRIELGRAVKLTPQALNAWECVQRGHWHMLRLRREDNERAIALFRAAIEQAPEFASAHGFLGIALAFSAMFGWAGSFRKVLAEAIAAAERGLSLDDKDPFVHRALGGVYVFDGRLQESIAENRRAIELNPSYALGYWGAGQQLALAGHAEEGLAMLRTAMRLSPNDPLTVQFLSDLSIAYFAAERYEEAVRAAEHSLRIRRESNWCWPFMIASMVELERVHEARRAAQEDTAASFSAAGLRLVLERIGADERLVARLDSALRTALP